MRRRGLPFVAVVPDRLIGEVARPFALLSDPTRLRPMRALHERGGPGVGELAGSAGISLVNASQHLTRLARAGRCMKITAFSDDSSTRCGDLRAKA
jgi:hypothetical protein